MYQKVKSYIVNNFTTEEDKAILNVFQEAASKIESFDSMKNTDGWKVLNQSLREELKVRLLAGIEKDERAQTILDILETVETTERSKLLEQEIEATLPK